MPVVHPTPFAFTHGGSRSLGSGTPPAPSCSPHPQLPSHPLTTRSPPTNNHRTVRLGDLCLPPDPRHHPQCRSLPGLQPQEHPQYPVDQHPAHQSGRDVHRNTPGRASPCHRPASLSLFSSLSLSLFLTGGNGSLRSPLTLSLEGEDAQHSLSQ